MARLFSWTLIICVAGVLMPLGCVETPRPLTASLFAPPMGIQTARDGQGEQQSTANLDAPVALVESPSPSNVARLIPLQPQPLESIQPLEALTGSVKAETVEPVAAASGDLPPAPEISSTAPSTSPAPVPGASSGVYMTIGGVLAKVNGTPIYSGQVLRRLEKAFTAKARDLNEVEFRDYAGKEIIRQRNELIQDEEYFNLALNSLDEKDREFAEQITIHIKQEKITAAGGSLEAAKRRAADDGQDFDEVMTQTYREIVHDLVQRRVIEPLVQVTAENMRDFYRINCPKLYSEKSKALFRVIQIDPAALTGDDPTRLALEKITAIREKAVRGDAFAALASAENTDSFLRSRGGDPGGWMEPNTYRLEDVEKSLWTLQPGEITPVIKCEGAFYIAKLVDKKIGVTRPFQDPTVQDDIYSHLRKQQIADRWQISKEQSFDEAIVTTSEEGIEIAVDLAMQKYKIMQTAGVPSPADGSSSKIQ